MARVKGSVATRARRKKILKKAEGYFGSKHLLFKTAKEQVLRGYNYAYASVVIVNPASVSFGSNVSMPDAASMESLILDLSMA